MAEAEAKEQSMEEILQSIKRIIAEESDDDGDAQEAMVNGAKNIKGSDVLELTDVVAEGETPAPPPEAPAAPAAANKSDILDSIDSLLSDEAARTSAAALRSLTSQSKPASYTPSNLPSFRSGTTVEDLMMEAMRPLLKEWLDRNLPPMVERLVEKEIRKLTP